MRKLLLILFLPVLAFSQTFPLKKSADNRYLVDQNDVPFQIRGDGVWCINTGLDSAEFRTYLLDRKARGYNTILFQMVQHYDGYNAQAPNNVYNVAPFTNLNDFTTTNEAYWVVEDVLFRLADSLDFLVIAIPNYLGYTGTEQGWDTEIAASGGTKMKTYARWVAHRYKAYNNVIWAMGGDRDPSSAEMAIIDSVRDGIRDTINTLLFTLNPGSPSSSSTAMLGRTWLWIDGTYDYDHIIDSSNTAYTRGTMPFFLWEAYAEHISNTDSWITSDPLVIRQQTWWSILSGSCGAFYTSDQGIFWNDTYWLDSLNSVGNRATQYCWSFMSARNWWSLVPDPAHNVLTAGYSTGDDRAVCSYAADSSFIAVYMPTNREITVDLNRLKTNRLIKTCWLNPISGVYTDNGTTTRGSKAFTPTGSQDWVFLAEAVEFRSGILTRRP